MLLLRGATRRRIQAGHAEQVSIHAPLARSNSTRTAAVGLTRSFQYMLLLRGATRPCMSWAYRRGFNTCSSCEEQLYLLHGSVEIPSFNTCSSCEEQLRGQPNEMTQYMFQYMLLLRGATWFSPVIGPRENAFQYMLLLRGATMSRSCKIMVGDVSIHAPLARSNAVQAGVHQRIQRFNTCSSCEEQHFAEVVKRVISTFQYMLLLRGATPS